MEITTKTTTEKTTEVENPNRKAAVNALAVVGFIVLILIGIALAIYAVRYVPVALNRLSTGAVSLSSIFSPADEEPEVDVVLTETTLSFEPIATSTSTSTPTYTTPAATPAPSGTGSGVTYGQPRTITVPVTVPPPAPYGLSDLTVDITAVGYCRTNSPDSFRRASEVPNNENGGIQFTIKNVGTNNSGRFDFTYELPTSPSLEKTISNQRSLAPNDRIEYTLCFTEPKSGSAMIRVDSGRDVNESNENNNTDSARISLD
jgi:hypothetical protein